MVYLPILQPFDIGRHYAPELRRNPAFESHLEVSFNDAHQTGAFLASRGLTVRIEWQYDHDTDAPWDGECGHGEVEEFGGALPSGWTDISPPDVRGTWGYNTRDAMTKAIAEKWSVDAATLKDWRRRTGNPKLRKTYAAVLADREHMRRYLARDWGYIGVTATILDAEGKEVGCSSLWGVAYDPADDGGRYVLMTLDDVVLNAAHEARALPEQRRVKWRSALAEARERKECAARGIATA
jgi:hypothetical protein